MGQTPAVSGGTHVKHCFGQQLMYTQYSTVHANAADQEQGA